MIETRPTSSEEDSTGSWDIEVFFDGECPLCVREIALLRKMDRKNRIVFTDISDREFETSTVGRNMETLMAEIHGRLPSGELITGVEVFRRLYSAVGFSLLVGITRFPVISHGLELGYRIFDRNRLRFTGRCSENGCAV